MSQNDQTHFKNLAATAARFLKWFWPFWDIMHVKGLRCLWLLRQGYFQLQLYIQGITRCYITSVISWQVLNRLLILLSFNFKRDVAFVVQIIPCDKITFNVKVKQKNMVNYIYLANLSKHKNIFKISNIRIS